MDVPQELRETLAHFRDRVRARLRLRGALALIAAWAGLAILLGLLDAWLSFETQGRTVLAALLGGTAVVGLLAVFWRSRGFTLQDAAQRLDAVTGDPRGLASIGSDLSSLTKVAEKREGSSPTAPPALPTLEGFLTRRALAEALTRLRGLPEETLTSRIRLRPVWALLGAALAVVIALAIWQPRATSLIAQRLFQPGRELPPYSRYVFNLDPSQPRVIYGKALSLAAEITGAPVEGVEVHLLTRSARSSQVDRLPVYREAGQRFAQKLEGVTTPLEVAFAIGRARSAWVPVEILWQPQLERSEVTITPPRYAGRKTVPGTLTGEIQGLRGSEVHLRLSSNRPLSGGLLEARVEGNNDVVEKVDGTPLRGDPRTVEFRWTISRDCRWTVDLRDIRGTRMAEPVRFVQRLVPDEKPAIDLLAPGPFAMATPSSAVKLQWQVSDDIGLDRASWVRTADGFRDRATALPGVGGERSVEVQREIQLTNLGVSPGQTLEFLLEARDRNPSLMGVSSSTPVKVKIISEEEYAEQIRVRTSIEEFAARYQVLRDTLDAAAKALDELAEAARSGDRTKIEAARQRALNKQKQAAEWFGDFADDFPAFATDKELSELSGDLQEELEKNAKDLEGQSGWDNPAKAEELAKQMRERLQAGSDKLDEQKEMADEFTKIASVAEMAAELQAIHQEQREVSETLARIAEEIAVGMTNNRHKVGELRQRQLRNEERLREVEEKLPERLAQLPESAAKLKEGAEKVLEGLKNFDVAKQMGDAVTKIGKGDLLGASNDSLLARGNLDQILGQPDNPFCDMCQGNMPGGMGSGGAAQQEALAQMMGALKRRAQGEGQGQGTNSKGGIGEGGQGFGAKGGSGSSMAGTQLPVPLIGPPRLQLNGPKSLGSTGDKSGDGRAGGSATSQPETASNTLPGATVPNAKGSGPSLDEVPMKYREAVKNYFSREGSGEAGGGQGEGGGGKK